MRKWCSSAMWASRTWIMGTPCNRRGLRRAVFKTGEGSSRKTLLSSHFVVWRQRMYESPCYSFVEGDTCNFIQCVIQSHHLTVWVQHQHLPLR